MSHQRNLELAVTGRTVKTPDDIMYRVGAIIRTCIHALENDTSAPISGSDQATQDTIATVLEVAGALHDFAMDQVEVATRRWVSEGEADQ